MKPKYIVTLFFAVVFILLIVASPALALSSDGDSEPVFNDIRGHWGETAILEMHFRGIMNGYQDNSFRPNYPVTQLEALVMLVRMTGFEPGDYVPEDYYLLNDIFEVPAWAIPYVDYAIRNEITHYKELERMNLKQPLLRQDAAVLTIRTLGFSKQATKNTAAHSFMDAEKINPELLGYVGLAVEKGIIKGTSSGNFLPTHPMSRAEIAALLTRAQSHLDVETGITEYLGTIKNIDPSQATVTLTLDNEEGVVVFLPQNSLIYRNNTPVTTDSLYAGDSIKLLIKTVNSESMGFMVVHEATTSTSLKAEKVNLLSAPTNLQALVEKLKLEKGLYAFIDDKDLYLLVCRGEQTNSGYTAEIKEVNLGKDGTITVDYITSDPIPGNLYLPVINYPYSLIKVKVDVKPSKVVFRNLDNSIEVKPKSL